jgi:hypothetical protein
MLRTKAPFGWAFEFAFLLQTPKSNQRGGKKQLLWVNCFFYSGKKLKVAPSAFTCCEGEQLQKIT